MAELNTKPGSSTPKQRSRLVVAGRRKGFDLDKIREMVGGSVKQLSALQACEFIERFGGGELSNPPGQKPRDDSRPQPGVTRMRTADQVEQITRMLAEYFDGDHGRAANWLHANFGVRDPEKIATRQRAGQIIRVLKTMTARKGSRKPSYKGKRE